MEPVEPDHTALSASFPIVPATNPDGGWGARRTPLPAPPLGLDPAQCDGGPDPLALLTLVVAALSPEDRRTLLERLAPEERARLAAQTAGPEGESLLMVRAGLRLFLGQTLDADPRAVVLHDGPCPHCGRPHDLAASSPAGRRLHFAAVGRGDLIVYAICRFPVGLGLGMADGPGREARLRARSPARLAAQRQAVARGRCRPPRDSSVEYVLRFVDTAPEHLCVVSVALEVPYRPDNPVFRDPPTD